MHDFIFLDQATTQSSAMSIDNLAGVFVFLAMGVVVGLILVVGEGMMAACRESSASRHMVILEQWTQVTFLSKTQ